MKPHLQRSRQWLRRIAGMTLVTLGFTSGAGNSLAGPTVIQIPPGCSRHPAPAATQLRLSDGRLQTSSDSIAWADCVLPVKTFVRAVTSGQSQLVAVGGSYLDVRAAVVTSPDGFVWTWRRIPTKRPLFAVAFGDGLFVTVGEAGAILTSRDGGARWTRRHSACDGTLLAAVAFGNGRFVAGGESGCILTSTNGVHWTRQNLSPALFVGRIDFVNNCFWVRNGSQTFSSPDALRWQYSDSDPDVTDQDLRSTPERCQNCPETGHF
jgi:hypothetical protein